MSYVDGYVIAVPTNNRDAFTRHAKEAAAVFKEHGASSVVSVGATMCQTARSPLFPWLCRRSPTRRWCSHGSLGRLVRRGTRA